MTGLKPIGPVKGGKLPWRPWWLAVASLTLYSHQTNLNRTLITLMEDTSDGATKRLHDWINSTTLVSYKDRRRIVSLFRGTALVTTEENRTFLQRLLRIREIVWNRFRRMCVKKWTYYNDPTVSLAENLRRREDREEKSKRNKLFRKMPTEEEKFREFMEDFLSLNYRYTTEASSISKFALEKLYDDMKNAWFDMGLGVFAVEWPAY